MNAEGTTATWTFASAFPDEKYAIFLDADQVISQGNGAHLDGLWDRAIALTDHVTKPDTIPHPAKSFPSGSGSGGGGNFRFHFALQNSPSSILAATPRRGDYSDNEIVDINDYIVWKMNFGQTWTTTPIAGDGNLDGQVDAADYTIWRNNLGSSSAWSAGASGAGLQFPVVQIGVAPQVTNVTISGSQSVHDPYSFDSVVGSGEQLRTVPIGGADTIAIAFSEDVNVMASDLSLVGLTTGNRPALVEFDYDIMTMTATWRFTGWTFGDNYLLSLKETVTDVEGNLLDGEWTNPAALSTVNSAVSEFPSGDGTMGGAFNFALTLLPGDATLDGFVDAGDLNLLLGHWGYTSMTFSDADFDGDGFVAMGDLNLLSNNWGLNLQALWLRGDLDGDFDVDQDDLVLLSSNQGMGSPTYADGDLDEDGDIDFDDLDFMFAQLGITFDLVS